MADTPLTELELLRWAESLAGIAQTGLAFTESLYEQERFEEILHVAAEIKAHSGRGFDVDAQVSEWMKGVGDRTAGYVTPKTAIGAVVGNDDGEIQRLIAFMDHRKFEIREHLLKAVTEECVAADDSDAACAGVRIGSGVSVGGSF